MGQTTSAKNYLNKSGNSAERHVQQRAEYDRRLIQSEEEYVKILCALVEGIYNPLKKYARRYDISKESVEQVFHDLEQMQQFHVLFLDGIRKQDRVLDAFAPFDKLTSTYRKYIDNYSQILDIVAGWRSKEFRKFVMLRLKHTNVSEDLEPRLSSLARYLYRPYDRFREYDEYLTDLAKIANLCGIDDREVMSVAKSVRKVSFYAFLS